MAEATKTVKLYNRGNRKFVVKGLPDSEGNPTSVHVMPGEVVEVSQETAKQLASYHELIDASKIGAAASSDPRVAEQAKEIKGLLAEFDSIHELIEKTDLKKSSKDELVKLVEAIDDLAR